VTMPFSSYYNLCRQAAHLRAKAVLEQNQPDRTRLHSEADRMLAEAACLPCCGLTGALPSPVVPGSSQLDLGAGGAHGSL
jgi:hypothetical protein